jgi:hypothetical protein
MKRSTFLKSLMIAVTAPSVLSAANPKKDIVKPDEANTAQGANLQYDTLVMFVSQKLNIHVGDLIESDMGDCALVTSTMQNCKIGADRVPEYEDLQQLWCKPVQMLRYHYRDINKFKVLRQLAGESSKIPIRAHSEPKPKMPSNATIAAVIR